MTRWQIQPDLSDLPFYLMKIIDQQLRGMRNGGPVTDRLADGAISRDQAGSLSVSRFSSEWPFGLSGLIRWAAARLRACSYSRSTLNNISPIALVSFHSEGAGGKLKTRPSREAINMSPSHLQRRCVSRRDDRRSSCVHRGAPVKATQPTVAPQRSPEGRRQLSADGGDQHPVSLP